MPNGIMSLMGPILQRKFSRMARGLSRALDVDRSAVRAVGEAGREPMVAKGRAA
jgi:hypothetical protein